MTFLEPLIDRASAWEHLHRRSFHSLRMVWNSSLRTISSGRLGVGRAAARLEPIWLPHYYASAEGMAGPKPVRAEVLVDACEGRATLCELKGTPHCGSPPAPPFKPLVTEPKAMEAVRQQLWKVTMLHSGWIRPVPTWKTIDLELIHYPFWVAYFENRRRQLYVRMLDAITGKLAGPSSRVALLTALTLAKKDSTPVGQGDSA